MLIALRSSFISLVVALIVAGTAPFSAQSIETTRGQLVVAVSDSTGARVADALVTLTHGAERRVTTSGNDGTVRFANLGAGEWTIAVTRDGFARWTQAITLASGAIDVPVVLAVAGVTETVQVQSDAGPPTQVPLNATATGGSRLDIPVRDLPASLFLVGQSLIQERGARSVEEAVQLAVGMQASTGVGSIPSYATRGWSGNDVSVMRDGIRQNSVSQSSRPVDAFLLDRIEILKGPASLLYGEGALGGAVNLVSKSPISQLNLDSLLAYGSYGQYRTGVGFNVPLRRNLLARVDLSQSGSDGYVKNSPQNPVEQIGLAYTPYPSLLTASQDYQPLTGRAGAIFEITPSANVYASYSHAVEPTTQLVSLDGSQQRFSLVPGSQFEVGTKGGAFGGRLEGTFAYFAIEKRDLLITQLIDGIQTAQQIGQQTSGGIEITVVARPTKTLTLAGDVAYTAADFVDFVEIVGGVNTLRSGNTPPNVPRNIWNFSPTQRIGPFEVLATIRHVGTRWGDNANTRLVSGFTTIDAAVGYRFSRGARLMLRGRNLTDEIYTQSVSNTAGRLEPPRAVDVTFTVNLKR